MWYEYSNNFMRYKIKGKYIIVVKKLRDSDLWMASVISKENKVEYITDEEVEVVKILSLVKAKQFGWDVSLTSK
jgi:hypothetical protein